MSQVLASKPWCCMKNGASQTFDPSCATIMAALDGLAEKHSDKEALVVVCSEGDTPFSITYGKLVEILHRSRDFFIDELKLQLGDAVSLLMANKPELLTINWSAWSNGIKTVPLDSKRDSLERKLYKLKLTQAKVLFVRTDQVDAGEVQQIRTELPKLRIVELAADKQYFDMVLKQKAASKVKKCVAFDDSTYLDSDCLILFTSGTTALPKGARLTPRSLWANAVQINHWLQINENDRFHVLLPLHHINSTTFSLATVLAGGTIVLSSRYSKSNFWRIMAEYKATLASVVPTIAYDLLSEQNSFLRYREALSQVSRIQIGSAPVQVNVVEAFYEKYHIRLVQGYGSTETSLRCTGMPYALPEADYLDVVHSNSIGTEMCYANVAILDADCQEVCAGEEGEICIRGPIVTRGYLDNAEATEQAFKGGWFHSGDLGMWKLVHGQKFLFIKGRLKEIIIKGGVNVSPLAIENAILNAFPEIDFCYAIGIPHDRYGEEIGLVAGGHPRGLKALKQAIDQRRIEGLLPFECPIAFLTVDRDALSKTSTGKIQRMKIKKQYGAQLAQL